MSVKLQCTFFYRTWDIQQVGESWIIRHDGRIIFVQTVYHVQLCNCIKILFCRCAKSLWRPGGPHDYGKFPDTPSPPTPTPLILHPPSSILPNIKPDLLGFSFPQHPMHTGFPIRTPSYMKGRGKMILLMLQCTYLTFRENRISSSGYVWMWGTPKGKGVRVHGLNGIGEPKVRVCFGIGSGGTWIMD